jgi:hypothetical protein
MLGLVRIRNPFRQGRAMREGELSYSNLSDVVSDILTGLFDLYKMMTSR